ncbi:hypothetical protein FJZ19_01180 [Candidatus Pacearchaeota archaeon]|nr:hypothetical protein [Candidatus Pacearchaeota archaeon]
MKLVIFVLLILFMTGLVSAAENIYHFSGFVNQGEISNLNINYIGEHDESIQESYLYYADFFDSSEAVLKSFNFEVYNFPYSEVQRFNFYADVPLDTRKIVFYNQGLIVKEVFISDNPPQADNIRVNNLGNNSYNVSWEASDTDSNFLSFRLFISNGTGNEVLSERINQTSYLFDTSFLKSGDYKIIVEAFDGFNFAEYESYSFFVSDKKPVAKIYGLINGSVFIAGEDIFAGGYCFDSEGVCSVLWKLNSQEAGNESEIVLENLSLGSYLLELEAQDDDKNLVRDSVNFLVDSISEPDVSVENIYIFGDRKMNQTHYIISGFFNIRNNAFCNISVYDNESLIYEEEAEIPANSYYGVYAQWLPQQLNNTIRIGARCMNESSIENNNKIISFQIEDPFKAEINDCMSLNESKKTYFLNSSIVNNTARSNCINIAAENITLDCQGNMISSSSISVGIYSNKRGTSIKNCSISLNLSYSTGIKLERADNSKIFGNILKSRGYGLYLAYTSNSTIENNTINYGSNGIYVYSGAGNILLGNNLTNNRDRGIWIYFSPNSLLANNMVANSSYGIWNYNSRNSSIINNTASKSIYGIWNYFSPNNIIINNLANNNKNSGIWNYYSPNSLIANNLAKNNTYGIWNYFSQNSSIINNTASNSIYGIWNYFSQNSSIINNTASNSIYGIYFFDFYTNSINNVSNNIACNNTYRDIYCYYSNITGTGNRFGRGKVYCSSLIYPFNYNYC